MDIQNLILYVFDVVMLVAFARMLMVSNTVKIETKVGNKMKWMIPVLFLAIAMALYVMRVYSVSYNSSFQLFWE